jgi:signal transduction histidine kinase/DNA-binding response OmpR family regulator
MSDPDRRASILIVDDNPQKLLSLQVVLEELEQRIVTASSGREALRHLLSEEFAVILLDVNMPDMDGFEAAALIRQRPSLRHVPIIFITAFGDETHMARGYSLGAVDYIHTPVIPEVLRSKVSVFVELYQKNAQVHRQSETLRRQATQLQKLAGASMTINGALGVEQMMQIVADAARDIIGAEQCLAIFTGDPESENRRPRYAASFANKQAKWRDRLPGLDALASTVIAQTPGAARLTGQELREHPDWDILQSLQIPTVRRGLLSAPLTDRTGKNLGLLVLLDRIDGQFGGEDEALLMQLARITSIAIQNAIFAREREANRLKDEFLATLSHELRTPLNAIVGWTQLLRMENLPKEAVHGLDVIDRNVKAQTKLIEDLLDVSRIITGKMRLNLRDVALAPLLQAAIDAIRPAAEAKQIELAADLAPEVRANADPDRLQQIVWNLLTNAVKFSNQRGRVYVTLERVNSHAHIRVSDTGQGIDPEFLRFVFDRFRQADSGITRSHGGLGIGLSIVRHIAELHGGSVEAQSPGLGKGSTFTVVLPVLTHQSAVSHAPRSTKNGEGASPAHQNRKREQVKLGGKRVLLIDDEADARELICEILRRAEADVCAVGCVRDALETIARDLPDVVISDLGMPEQDGYALIQTLRQMPSERGGLTPAIALTAYAREEDRIRALSAGFQMHLTKPVDPDRLVEAIAYLSSAPSNHDPQNGADSPASSETELSHRSNGH